MSESTKRGSSLIKLGKLANNKKFEELEEAWLEILESSQVEPEHLLPIAGQVGRLGAEDKAESMIWVLLSALEERAGPAEALQAARLAASELPSAAGLGEQIVRLYGGAHPDRPELAEILPRIFSAATPLDRAVAMADAVVRLRPGAFIRDHAHLMPGIVEGIDHRHGTVTARFDRRHQDYPRDVLAEIEVLPEDHFEALLVYDPERLSTLAGEQPVQFVIQDLLSAKDEQLSYRDLKAQVTRLLGEKGWKTWWAKARDELRRAPRLELSGGSQPTIRLRKQDQSYEDRLRAEYARHSGPIDRLALILSYLDETTGNVIAASEAEESRFVASEDLLVHFGNGAAQMAVGVLQDTPAVALACLAVHAAVAARGVPVARPNPNAAGKVLARIPEPAKLSTELPEALLIRTLEYLRSALPDDWPDIWADVLTRGSRRICDVVSRRLLQQGRAGALERALAQAIAQPTTCPDTVCWLWRARHAGTLREPLSAMVSLPVDEHLQSLLSLADAAGRLVAVSAEERHRRTLELVQNVLAWQAGQPVRTVFAACSPDTARRFKSLIVNNSGLTAAGRTQLVALLRAAHEELFLADIKPWEDDVIYTTQEGLQRQQQVLQTIMTEDIPAVAKQIGEAAAFGDLSENAEFTAALEKRDQLTSRATRMENELKRAVVINVELADSATVTVGSRVRARDLDRDATEEFLFLGPWDSRPEQGILTYNAPLSLAFMGKRVGDEVEFGEGEHRRRFEVLSVESGL